MTLLWRNNDAICLFNCTKLISVYYFTKFHLNTMNSFRVMDGRHFLAPTEAQAPP